MLLFRSCLKRARWMALGLFAPALCAPVFMSPAFITPVLAQPVNEIVWTLTPLPPAMVEKDGKIVGYGVDTLDWFIDRLPAYRHKKEIVPLPRLMQSLTEGGTLCNIGMNKTPEREQILVFSDAVLPHLPVSLVTQTKNDDRLAPYLDDDDHVDLVRLIKSGKLNGAIRAQRSYGAVVDPILKSFSGNPTMTVIGTDEQFLPMITLDRIDWTLYFPAELEYHRRQKTPDTRFTTWPIVGNDHVIPASIACTKTQTGHAVVNDINALVVESPEMPWVTFYTASLSQSDRKRYAREVRFWQAHKDDITE